jgi:hypothetical protein
MVQVSLNPKGRLDPEGDPRFVMAVTWPSRRTPKPNRIIASQRFSPLLHPQGLISRRQVS